ncbi:MAG TPA: peptidylprolyl isomerase [Candidatus Norongarragalinales archaeon]|nr:peptidylprolyl isomerase [Candidatus Norongarragalinales archaeon]
MRVLALLLLAFLFLGCTQTGGSQLSVNATPVVSTPNFSGETKMLVKNGDTVHVDYVGSTEGKVFDTSLELEAKKANLPPRPVYEPLEFKVGSGQVVPGFDKAPLGLSVGQEKTVDLAPVDGYGERDAQLIVNVSKSNFGNATDVRTGMEVYAPSGQPGKITQVFNDTVTVDFNHFLAGKTLKFRIILRAINPK